jgi:hypothetical protein
VVAIPLPESPVLLALAMAGIWTVFSFFLGLVVGRVLSAQHL